MRYKVFAANCDRTARSMADNDRLSGPLGLEGRWKNMAKSDDYTVDSFVIELDTDDKEQSEREYIEHITATIILLPMTFYYVTLILIYAPPKVLQSYSRILSVSIRLI